MIFFKESCGFTEASMALWKVHGLEPAARSKNSQADSLTVPCASNTPKTKPSAPRSPKCWMSCFITSSSLEEYTKSPPRGRIMTKMGRSSSLFKKRSIPALGVSPPSGKLAHNSRRSIPCSAASMAACTLKTGASKRMLLMT